MKRRAMRPADTVSALDECAARWAVRVDAGTLSAAEESELDAWTRSDPRHAGAFARAMAANAYFDRAAALRAQDIGEQPAADDAPPTIDEAPRMLSRRAWIGGGLGAIAATLVAVIGASRWQAEDRLAAPRGSVRRAALADGSAVTLNTSAEIAVAMAQDSRRVRLIAGEVNFDVAKDRTRPFLVDAGAVQVRVVGTSFLVRRTDGGEVAVTVREGIVEVRRDDDAPVRLLAGDRLVIGTARAVRREILSMADVDRLGLWQRGQMDLTGMTLGDAAREFARYSDLHIRIPDSQVARLKVAGIYSTSDPAGFAEAAALAQGLHIETTGQSILLSR
jgi:transmembrane sensor